MLTNSNQKTSFDQFLFLNFDIKKQNKSVSKMDFCSSNKKKVTKRKTPSVKKANSFLPNSEINKKTLSKKEVETIVLAKRISMFKKDKIADLVEVVESIPRDMKSTKNKRIAHKHESEWYHAFRDLQDKIIYDLSKKHPNYNGIFKLKDEIKEFSEQLDEHIEKFMLELDRLFQNFPNMSRVAVIYLLSLIISIPLVFFSAKQDSTLSFNSNMDNQAVKTQHAITEQFTAKTKSEFIAKNSADILASGQTIVQVTKGKKIAKVAGAYEKKNSIKSSNIIKAKVYAWYSLFYELKDEATYFISKKINN